MDLGSKLRKPGITEAKEEKIEIKVKEKTARAQKVGDFFFLTALY